MSIYNGDNDLDTETIPVFGLVALLGSLFILNYISMKMGSSAGSIPLAVFITLLVGLFFLNPVYCFVFCIVMHVDVMSCFGYNWAKLLTLACMFIVFVKDGKSLFLLFNDKKVKTLIFMGFIFGLYLLLINIGYKAELNAKSILGNIGYMIGFLTIIPAYYFTLKQPKKLLMSFALVAAAFLSVYYISLIMDLDLFRLKSYDRDTGANIDRLAGYDLRQFIIFFSYLLPAAALSTRLKNTSKYLLILIGIFSYVVLILAFYRLAMFYVTMGAFLSFFLIRKYVEALNLFKYLFLLISVVFLSSIFFGEYLTEIQNLFSNTVAYFSGNATDSSADTRFDFQFPIMTKLFFDNFWTGIGLTEIKGMQAFGMFGFVDMPFIGTLTAFGVIGMFLYYIKFFVLLSGTKKNLDGIDLDNHDPFIFFLYSTLKAYFITMVTFRFFYISWELSFDYQQAEFGLFAGVFLGLHYFLKQAEYETEEEQNKE
ncbi:hypothetical protein [Flavobacterium sp.]|uniref:hypothetical protein n=1 Tax=Flavobacterium sp. TaxID=239 RepID=UPI00374D0395